MLGIVLRLLGRTKHLKALTLISLSLLLVGIGMYITLTL